MDAATLVVGLFPLRILPFFSSSTRHFFIGFSRGGCLDGAGCILFFGQMGSGPTCSTAQRFCQPAIHPGS